jgi:hypothetical protein
MVEKIDLLQEYEMEEITNIDIEQERTFCEININSEKSELVNDTFEEMLKTCEIKFEFEIGKKKCKLLLDIGNNVDIYDVSNFLAKHVKWLKCEIYGL